MLEGSTRIKDLEVNESKSGYLRPGQGKTIFYRVEN